MADSVFGLSFTAASEAELARDIAEQRVPPGTGVRLVATANLDHIARLSRSAAFRKAYSSAWRVTADGMPVYLYARLRGIALPERVTGSGMCGLILDRLTPSCHRPFFVLNANETANRLRAALLSREFPLASLGFVVPPFGFERDVVYNDALAAAIEKHGTTHLFMCVGSPKSEIWAEQHSRRLGDCYVLNFGAGLEYATGLKKRAPKVVQRVGFEWAWRLAHEPRRLFSRYMFNSWGFLLAIGRDLTGRWA